MSDRNGLTNRGEALMNIILRRVPKLRLLAVLIGVVTVAIITQNIDSRNREACIQEGRIRLRFVG